MRVVVVGLGIQGRKRRAIAGNEVVAIVDPVITNADYRDLTAVPSNLYDAALVCTPDPPKIEILRHLLSAGKHVLVEKPVLGENLAELQGLAALQGVTCYTAYNHRFEPHFRRMRDAIGSGVLGDIYRVRMFYGNGTARDVRNSPWRDEGLGVLADLGSHLLDTLAFWLGSMPTGIEPWRIDRFENLAPDHAIVGNRGLPLIELEMSLLSWRNHFVAEVVGSKASATIESLCKWGPSTFTLRQRVLPSGKPPQEAVTLEQADPTWALEYAAFKQLCDAGSPGNLADGIAIHQTLEAWRRAL